MRIRTWSVAAALTLALLATTAIADPPRTQIEIYRIAPGQHEAFVRFIALCDRANRDAGLQPRQLYVHQDGASWDFIILQPADITLSRVRLSMLPSSGSRSRRAANSF